ncbi:MAG: glycosyltransferase family 4 protein [Planctomycetota bacterium]
MHVVLLNQPFYPDVAATAQMAKDLADHLVARGHTVTAVCSRSIYGQQGATLPKRETIDGIQIRRVGSNIFGKKGIAARLADFGLFYLLATWTVLTLPKPSVVVGFTTPPFIAFVGVLARWLRGAKAVYWVMDVYPDVPMACGVMKPSSPITKLCAWFNRFLLKRSDTSVVLGRCMRDLVINHGAPPERVALIPVWADHSGISPIAPHESAYRSKWELGDRFVVMYSGNLGLAHDADTMIDAMERLKDNERIRFVFVGGGKLRGKVEAAIEDRTLTNAEWHEYVPREDLGQSLTAADVHLISVKNGLEGTIVPSKLFGVMAAGRASVYIGRPTSEIARVLDETAGGVLVEQGDGEGLARVLTELADDPDRVRQMGAAARRALEGQYDAQTLCGEWTDLLEALVAGPASTSDDTTNTAS